MILMPAIMCLTILAILGIHFFVPAAYASKVWNLFTLFIQWIKKVFAKKATPAAEPAVIVAPGPIVLKAEDADGKRIAIHMTPIVSVSSEVKK